MNDDTPCTAEQREAILRAAQARVRYLEWLAMRLRYPARCETERDRQMRFAASDELLQIAGVER